MSAPSPNGSWKATTLAEIARVVRGRVNPQDCAELPFIGMDSVEPHTMQLLSTVPARTMKSASVHFQPGDVLYGRLRPYLNKVIAPDFEGLASAEFIPLTMSHGVAHKFIQYRINAADFVSYASRLDEGDRPRVDYDQIGAFRLILPPSEEQHRIVAAIESYFTRLDDAVASLERVQRNLKRYRASVLKSAVEGRLVPTEAELARTEGRDYEPASVLLERILAERRHRWEEAELAKMNAKGNVPKNDKWKSKYPQPEANDSSALPNLPPGWACAHLTQLLAMRDHALKAGPFGSALKKEYYVDTGYKIYGQEQVLRGDPYYGHYFIDESRYLQLASCAVRPRDVLISLVGTIGRTLVIPDDALPGIINPRLIKISVNEEVVLPEYLQIFFASPSCREILGQTAHGGTMDVLNMGALKSLAYPVPPLREQHRIVASVRERESVLAHTLEDLKTSLLRIDRLRQSILKWAFEGRLVDQDPTDEPASKLLERIKSERAAEPVRSPSRRPRRGTSKRKSG